VLLGFLQPVHHIEESVVSVEVKGNRLPRHVVSQEDAVRTTVEDPCDRSEGLLPRLSKSEFLNGFVEIEGVVGNRKNICFIWDAE
jgi:hypothetical protein